MSDFDRIDGPRPIADDSWLAGDARTDAGSSTARPRGRTRLVVIAVVLVLLGTAAAIVASRRSATSTDQPALPAVALTDPTPPAAVAPAVSRPIDPAGSTATLDRPPTPSVPPAAPSGSPAPTPTQALFPAHTSTVVAASGLCLDDGNNRTTEGNPVKVFNCNSTTAQAWTFGADGTIRVHNMCLHPEPANPAPGALLAIYTCGANAFETWRPGAGGSIVNIGSRLCLTDPTGTGTTDRVSLRACDGGARQHWT